MAGQYRDMDFLWKEQYFGDYGLSISPRFPDLKLNTIQEDPPIRGGLHRQANGREYTARSGNHVRQDHTATLVALLKACAKQKDLCRGTKIHTAIRNTGLLRTNVYVGTGLLNMYAKCGDLAKAQEVFEELPVRNLVSWNALIAGYCQYGRGREALDCFEQMQQQGISPDAVTFTCILKACGRIGAAEKGEEIHAEVIRQGLLEKDTLLGTALVDMYAKCGAIAKAREVFDELPVQDVVSWSALIAGYTQQGLGHEALTCFEEMQQQGLPLNDVTLICILKACGSVGAAKKGEEIHAEIVRWGLLEKDTILGTALVDMYVKCGALAKAREVFDKLPVQDVVSWSALISGYVQHGHGLEALNCFEKMQHQGLSPDAVTFTCILKACSSIGAAEKGEEVHAAVIRQGLLEKDHFLGTALVDMYAKCGALAKAQEVFDNLPVWNVVLWNALIAGYVQYGHGYEALNCFEQMQRQGFCPDDVTFTCILKACGSIGAIDKGKEIHAEVVRQGLLGKNTILGIALVDMYAKCSALAKAQEVFDELSLKNIVSWSALIAGQG